MSVGENLAAVRARISAACAAVGRDPASVRLLAVSKTFGPEALAAARAAGQAEFGESYLQEALPKIAALGREGLRWHFIGPVQSNKTREIAAAFDWVHGVDRLKIAQRLSDQRPAESPPLEVCVQVNISGETSKSGVVPGDALALCRAVCALPRLRLRGLMAIPEPGPEPRKSFARLRDLFDALRRDGLPLDTLSAGMSDDLEAAIAEGSTLVRVGTAIFGNRGNK